MNAIKLFGIRQFAESRTGAGKHSILDKSGPSPHILDERLGKRLLLKVCWTHRRTSRLFSLLQDSTRPVSVCDSRAPQSHSISPECELAFEVGGRPDISGADQRDLRGEGLSKAATRMFFRILLRIGVGIPERDMNEVRPAQKARVRFVCSRLYRDLSLP